MRVQLFATCLGDLFFPDVAALLEASDVEFPARQTCHLLRELGVDEVHVVPE